MPDKEEIKHDKVVSSQWLNLGHYTLATLLAIGIVIVAVYSAPVLIALLIPVIYAFWFYLTIRCNYYEITTQRLRIFTGVINQKIDEIELYRVKDILIERVWWMRLLSLGTIRLETSDRSLPQVAIPAVKNSIELRENLRKLVETMRDAKRVREMDFDETQNDGSIP